MEMFYILEGLVKGMLYRNAEVQVCSFGEQYKFSFNVCPTTKLDIHEGSPSHTDTNAQPYGNIMLRMFDEVKPGSLTKSPPCI